MTTSTVQDDAFSEDGAVTISIDEYRELIAVADMNQDQIDGAVAQAVRKVGKRADGVPQEIMEARILRGLAPVAAWRANRDLSVDDLAEASGIEAATVAAADRGEDVSAKALARIARVLDTRVDHLIDLSR